MRQRFEILEELKQIEKCIAKNKEVRTEIWGIYNNTPKSSKYYNSVKEHHDSNLRYKEYFEKRYQELNKELSAWVGA